MKRTLTLFLCAMGFCFQVALSDTVRVTPDDDMYTDPDNPTGHSQAELWTADWAPVNNFQRICMRFDLAEYEGHEISSATLKLYRFFGCPTENPRLRICTLLPRAGQKKTGRKTSICSTTDRSGQAMSSVPMAGHR